MDAEASAVAHNLLARASRFLYVLPRKGQEEDWTAWSVVPTSSVPRGLLDLRLLRKVEREAGVRCDLRSYLQSLICGAFTFLYRTQLDSPRFTWRALVLRVVARMEGVDLPPLDTDRWRREFFRARQAAVDSVTPPGWLLRAMSRRQPFAISHDPSSLIRASRPGRAAPRATLREQLRISTPWFTPLVAQALQSYSTAPPKDEARQLLALGRRLDGGAVFRGEGDLEGFMVRRFRGRLEVSCEVGPPFLQEIVPGTYILWEQPLEVVGNAPGEYLLHGGGEIPMRARVRHDWVARPGRQYSNLNLHAFVSRDGRSICMAGTSAGYRDLGAVDPVHALLEGRLRAARRVLRYAVKRSNKRTPHNRCSRFLISSPPGHTAPAYVVMDGVKARAYQRAHPETEIVPWDR